MGYKKGMKVKKSLIILDIFGYPIEKSAEIFEIWRLEPKKIKKIKIS
jgi:hypothetical protein